MVLATPAQKPRFQSASVSGNQDKTYTLTIPYGVRTDLGPVICRGELTTPDQRRRCRL